MPRALATTSAPRDLETPVAPARPATTALIGLLRRLRERWGSLLRLRSTAPDWVLALAVFAASRLVDGYVIARNAALAGTKADGTPYGYLDILGAWDGTWYRAVLLHGYPTHLHLDAAGQVGQNTWAFYPLFPALVGGVMALTGASFVVAASIVSTGCGALAAVGMQKLVAAVAGRRLGLWTVVLFCFFPAGAVLQLPYAESTAMALLVGVLLCLQRRRYLAAVPLVILVGLTRPIGVPLAAVVVLHGVRVLVRRRRGQDVLPRRSVAALVTLCAAAVLAAVEWPVTVALRTGRLDAYTQTMASWRNPRQVRPFVPWHDAAERFLGSLGMPILVVIVGAFVVWVVSPRAAVIAGDLRAWCLCYVVYLLAAMDSFTSLPRYLLPLFPLGTLLAAASRECRAYRVALLVAFAAGSVLWIAVVWRSTTMAP